MIPFLFAAILLLIIFYMTYPRFQRRILSSARFFSQFPPPRKKQFQFKLGKIQWTLPFILQLLIFILFLATLFLFNYQFKTKDSSTIGIWIVIDTSASMSTRQDSATRIELAIEEAQKLIQTVEKLKGIKSSCFRLSTFDMERRDIIQQGSAFQVKQVLEQIKYRPLGTDLGIIRGLLKTSITTPSCPITHLAVVSDIPAPTWISDNSNMQIIWRDIGKPVDNIGFTRIQAIQNPLTGSVAQVKIDISAFNSGFKGVLIHINKPNGQLLKQETLNINAREIQQITFEPNETGLYSMNLSNGGAYTFDDTAAIQINQSHQIPVDWQVSGPNQGMIPPYFSISGKSLQDSISPILRVVELSRLSSSIPTNWDQVPLLIIGAGYSSTSADTTPNTTEISDFVESSPLLSDINLDAIENLQLQAVPLESFPPSLQLYPVLRLTNGKIIAAQSENPLIAYIPGLPTQTEDVRGRVSATLFFNALRWLLQSKEIQPLYTLTSPFFPTPSRNRIVLHPDEGNTTRIPRSFGNIENIKPAVVSDVQEPLWPILLMIAALLFFTERFILIFGKK